MRLDNTNATALDSYIVQGSHDARRSPDISIGLAIVTCICVPLLLAYAFAMGDETKVIATVIIVCGLIACLAIPYWGLVLFLCLLFTRPEESITQLAGMHFTLIVALVTLVGMYLRMCINKIALVKSPFYVMMLGVFFASLVSAVVIGNVLNAFEDIGRLLILVILVVNIVRTPGQYKIIVSVIIALTVYIGAYSIWLYANGMAIKQDGLLRSQGTGIFGDPNDLAAVIVAGLALSIGRIIGNIGWRRSIYVMISIILIIAILFTNSRGGMLALLSVIIGYGLASNMSKSVKFAMVVFAVILYIGIGAGRMTNFDVHEASANSRFWFWDNGIMQLITHPLIGVGYGGFADVNGGMVAHNSFVQCFAELGLIGYFFWIGCIYASYRLSQLPAGISVQDKAEIIGSKIALAGYLVASFWLTHTYNPILFLLLALPIVAKLSSEKQDIVQTNNRWFPKYFTHISALCLGSIIIIKIMADHYK